MTVSSTPPSVLGAEVCQVCWAVPSVDAALPMFEWLYGPFEIMEFSLTNCEYRGRKVTTELRVALIRSTPFEKELIEQRAGEGPFGVPPGSPPVFNHLKLAVPDFDVAMNALREDGFALVYGGTTDTLAFAYLESPQFGSTMLELIKRS